jgi:hypothetical protein
VRRVVALLLGLSLVVSGVLVACGPDARMRAFESYLRLARLADIAYDAEPTTDDRDVPLELHVLAILGQFMEDGITPYPDFPTSVSFDEYGRDRGAVAGRYYPGTGRLTLNARYVIDPAWKGNSYLGVLVHELVHAQGEDVVDEYNEAATEVIAYEVTAALGNMGYPGARADILDTLRRDALSAAFWIAHYGGTPEATVKGAQPRWGLSPTVPDPDAGLVARVAEARAGLFSPAELRRVDKGLRYRLGPTYPGDYGGVLDAYVVRPLAVILASVGDDDPTCVEDFREESDVPMPYPISRVGPLQLDDLDALLREIGFL